MSELKNDKMTASRRNFLVDAPRMRPEELDIELEESDAAALEEFEDCWHDFLAAYPSMIPTGAQGARIEELHDQLDELRLAKENVASELNRQLTFFSKSRDQLETNFKKAMAIEASNQQRAYREWNHQTENIEVSNQAFNQILPWEHFFENLDKAVEAVEAEGADGGGSVFAEISETLVDIDGGNNNSIKPSARALTLVDKAPIDDIELSRDCMLRASRIDNALLSAEVTLLKRQIDRQEKMTDYFDVMGRFMIEHGIWGLMTHMQHPAPPSNAASITYTHRSNITKSTHTL